MATAKKLPSGNYRVRAYDKATGKYKSFTAKTKKEAELMAAEWLNEKVHTDNEMTLWQAAENYINKKSPVLSPTTGQGYLSILKNHGQRFENVLISNITPQMVQDWVNELAARRSPKTVANVYGFFKSVLKYNNININFSQISLPKKVKKFKAMPPADVVVNAFRGSDIEIPVLLGVWGGLRMSEIHGIRRKDIVGDILTISQVRVTVNRQIVTKSEAKSYESNRQIRLGKPLVDLIDALDLAPDDYVVTYTTKQIYNRFVKKMHPLGYEISFHDLRHISASVMATLKIPDIYAMERGGWSNTYTLKSVYQQTFHEDRMRVDKIIDDYFTNIYDTKCDTDKTK